MNGSYKELLSVGQPTFDLKERITMASAVKGRPHYVLVATTHSLILLDDRLPSQLVCGLEALISWACFQETSISQYKSLMADKCENSEDQHQCHMCIDVSLLMVQVLVECNS